MLRLASWKPAPGEALEPTASAWLTARQPTRVIELFWQPVIESALGESIDQWRKRDVSMDPEAIASLIALIAEQAEQCELSLAGNWSSSPETAIEDLRCQLQEIEESLIPYGLHVVGELLAQEDQIDLLNSIARAHGDVTVSVELLQDLLQ